MERILADCAFGDHNVVFYSNSTALDQLLIKYCRKSIEESNEILLLLTYHNSMESILDTLEDMEIDTKIQQKDGSLVIRDSAKACFNPVDELVDITIMIKMLLQRMKKLNKFGLTVISDMGIFFHRKRIFDLICHESRLSLGSTLSSVNGNKIRMLCCYQIADFASVTELQKQQILNTHSKVLSYKDVYK
jgi:hypothetical protein